MSKYVLRQFAKTDDESLAKAAFHPGMYLYGYCCGFFGRDSYGKKLIIKITDDSIEVVENSVRNSADTTTSYFSWVDLLESSNRDLESPDYNWDRGDFE